MCAVEKYLQGFMGPAIGKQIFKQQKLCTILLPWPWRIQKSLFDFNSPKGNGVMCICL